MAAFWKKGGGGENQAPPPPGTTLTASRLLGDLLAGLPKRAAPGASPRVLITGPPSGVTIETFHALGCRVTVAGDDRPEGRVDVDDRSVDLVLAFDLLDLLERSIARTVVEEWARVIRPSGGLYLLARQDKSIYPPPWRVDVLPEGTLRLVPLPDTPARTVHTWQNREIEELVRPLALRDIFLRKGGLREILCRRT
jgi:hypothetical protein